MELGPFEASDALRIEQIFNKHKIDYQIEIDESLKKSQLNDFHGLIRKNPSGSIGSLNLRYIYFIISEEDCRIASNDLKQFGLEI